jgi:hypothetical protein
MVPVPKVYIIQTAFAYLVTSLVGPVWLSRLAIVVLMAITNLTRNVFKIAPKDFIK